MDLEIELGKNKPWMAKITSKKMSLNAFPTNRVVFWVKKMINSLTVLVSLNVILFYYFQFWQLEAWNNKCIFFKAPTPMAWSFEGHSYINAQMESNCFSISLDELLWRTTSFDEELYVVKFRATAKPSKAVPREKCIDIVVGSDVENSPAWVFLMPLASLL